jgi:hypothetical protein
MKKLHIGVLIYCLPMLLGSGLVGRKLQQRSVSKSGMTVNWNCQKNRMFFEMSAKTTGWLTLGFNDTPGIKGAYLLMGRVVDGKAEVVEHYTLQAGDYRPIASLGGTTQVEDVDGVEKNGESTIYFSLPLAVAGKYQKQLVQGKRYHWILAYSREDDFQHHSIMRTAVEVQL